MPKASKRAGKPRPKVLAKGINSLSHAQVRRRMMVMMEGMRGGDWLGWRPPACGVAGCGGR